MKLTKTGKQLMIIFVLVSMIIIVLPYDYENHGIVPDEIGFYEWGMLYKEGVWKIPVNETEGVYHSVYPFFLSDSEISIQVDVSSDDGDGYFFVSYSNGTSIENAQVSLLLPNSNLTNYTDENGEAVLHDIPFGMHMVEIEYLGQIIHVMFDSMSNNARYGISYTVNYTINSVESLNNSLLSLRYINSTPAGNIAVYIDDNLIGYTDNFGNILLTNMQSSLCKMSTSSNSELRVFLDNDFRGVIKSDEVLYLGANANVTLTFEIRDIFNDRIQNAEVFLGNPDNIIGVTDEEGIFEFTTSLRLGETFSGVVYEIDGYEIPTASVIVEIDGSYYYVSRWPPGPSIMIGILSYISAEALMGILCLALLTFTTYKFSQRYFDEKLSFMLTLLTMFSGVVLVSAYTRWMGDLPSVAFSFFGFYLFIESLDDKNKKYWIMLSFLAGLCFGIGVAMRYSSLILIAAPLIYFAIIFFKNKNKIDLLKKAVPALIGVLIFGLLIASYNSAVYGGAFKSGYQYEHTLDIDSSGNTTEMIEDENFFESYFVFISEDFENIPHLLFWMFLFIPTFYLSFVTVWRKRKDPLVLALFSWCVLTLIIYFSLASWVLVRNAEDIRYFLPFVPSSILLFGFFWKGETDEKKRNLIFLLLIISGILVASVNIGEYMTRISMQSGMPNGMPQLMQPMNNQMPPGGMNEPTPAFSFDKIGYVLALIINFFVMVYFYWDIVKKRLNRGKNESS